MRILSLIAVVVFVSSLAAPARAGMAEDCVQESDPDLGISGCTAAIRSGQWQGESLTWAYNNRAGAYLRLGEYRRAIQDSDTTLRLDPGNSIAYLNRGLAYHALLDYRRAIQDFDQAIRLDPNNAIAYFGRGDAYGNIGEHRRGIQDFDQALRLGLNSARISARLYFQRGLARSAVGEHRRAIQDLDQAIRLDPDNANIYLGRGGVFLILGERRRAIQDFEQALRLDPNNAFAELALDNLNQGEYAKHQPEPGSVSKRPNSKLSSCTLLAWATKSPSKTIQ